MVDNADLEVRLSRLTLSVAKVLMVLLIGVACWGWVLTGIARAGGYDVFACDASHGGGASSSWALSSDPGLTAYGACPASNNDQGLIARSSWDNGSSGWLQGAYGIFDAPPGTTVESFHGWVYLQRPSCDWSVGIWASNYDLVGTGVYHLPPGYCSTNAVAWTYRDLAINAGRVRFEARCGASSCARGQTYSGGPGTAEVRVKDVRVHVRDDQAPSLTNPRGSLWADGWVGGSQAITFDAGDGAGIRETAIRIDGVDVRRNVKPCDYQQRVPCPSVGFSTTVETAAVKPDGRHRLTLEAVDAGGNVTPLERDVLIDNTPPAPPQGVHVVGGDGWRSKNGFEIAWSNPSETGVAPVAGAAYEICPIAGGSCTRGQRSGAGVSTLEGIQVPAAGEYDMRVWLRDAAGNQDARTAAAPVRLRFDDAAPDLAFEAPDPADPTLLSVRVDDDASGIGNAGVEIKPRRSDVWRPLATQVAQSRLTARIDDEALRDGLYDLRARAVDLAENERSTVKRTDGRPAELRLPVRLKTRLRVGLRRQGHARIRFRSRSRVPFGRALRLSGRLLTRDGNPIQDADVLVFSKARSAGAPARLVATLKTSRRGGFSFRAAKGVSRTITFRYGGTPNVRSTTRRYAVLVRARSSVTSGRRTFVNGETMRLRGRLSGGSIPAEGKLVELQVMLRGRWRTFATTRASQRGRWQYDYRFDGTRGLQTYLFRVRVPREATYPYETGVSRVVRVRVRGL